MLADRVPNAWPVRASTHRLAIVAESPGTQERSWATCATGHQFATEWRDQHGPGRRENCPVCGTREVRSTPRPLVGPSGHVLDQLLAGAGIERDTCLVCNVSQRQPPGNDITRFKWEGPEVQEGLAALRDDLVRFQPHFVLCLGGTALRALVGEWRSVDAWRGSLFMSDFLSSTLHAGENTPVATPVKCLATYHPARLLREWGLTGVVRFDIARVVEELRTDALVLPVRHYEWPVDNSVGQRDWLLGELRDLAARRPLLSLDIEGGVGGGLGCIGFADSAIHALVVPVTHADGTSFWDEESEIAIMEAVVALLEDEAVPKVIMNALYELFVLAWVYGLVIRGLRDDIMLKHHELYCELPKGLDFQGSIYTREPYWSLTHRQVGGRYVPFKGGRPATSAEWYHYNATDCCVTFEVNEVLDTKLAPRQREHYAFNVSCLMPLLYMQLRGFRYDKAKAKARLDETRESVWALQDELNVAASTAPERGGLRLLLDATGGPAADTGPAHGVLPPEALCDDGAYNDRTATLLPLLTSAFCRARRTEEREVETTTWQPMRWRWSNKAHTKGRWVKSGSRLDHDEAAAASLLEPTWAEDGEPDGTALLWLKPHRKRKTRHVPVAVASLADVRRFALDSRREDVRRTLAILAEDQGAHPGLAPARRGELATLLGLSVKIDATGRGRDTEAEDGTTTRGAERDANWFVYTLCGAPPVYKKEAGRLTDKLTTDDHALIAGWRATGDARLHAFLRMRSALTRAEALSAKTDEDGRVRCGYNVTGTETVRLTCYKSPTGSGYNLQTVTEELRDLFPADPGCEMGQCDLRGADGWTIAAEAARFGDTTMLGDLRAGIKPVNVIVLMMTLAVNRMSRNELLVLQKTVDKASWQYIATKPTFYGKAYLMGSRKMSEGILETSYKETGTPVYVAPKRCEEIMGYIDTRYPGIRAWQEDAGRRLIAEGRLTTCAGHTRTFYGRKRDAKAWERPDRQTLGEWLGHSPQFVTTYATKLGLMRVWSAPENRREDGTLRVEPLHTVHDSLNVQWRVEEREFARALLGRAFDNPLTIAGTTLTIPASGTYGPSWGEQEGRL